MEITIATSFDTKSQKEVFTVVDMNEELMKATLTAVFNSLDYEQRQAWVAKNQKAGKLVSVREL